ncbi:hypothetical protein [Hymenobacter sp. APR13]|uniref:hypothetical protein n=1 Tax=Hymenobacter sp. APR13 TaxID=1356852 RepID=UPI0012E09832|nr:hypothetical protein [Hymenobacter sp. APR13]
MLWWLGLVDWLPLNESTAPGPPATPGATALRPLTKAAGAGGHRHVLSSGETLRLRRRADTLYLSVQAAAPGWAHVYLANADSVWVLHASAALGQQLYVRGPRGWTRRSTFQWELRATGRPSTEPAARDYFRRHGWSATTHPPGAPGSREFRVRLPALRGSNWLSVVYATAAGSLSVFPRPLTDDTRQPALVRGGQPDTLQFQPHTWHQLPPRLLRLPTTCSTDNFGYRCRPGATLHRARRNVSSAIMWQLLGKKASSCCKTLLTTQKP